ncbi:MAG: dTMP kinase [Clostridia bacterium]|nr:dTMP kinase [Clostridia bacterium]
MKGKFITFEGCEGSGKSTQIRLLSERLTKEGIKHLVTREPGGSDVAEQIRTVILNKNNSAMCDECEALLYAAARIQHLTEIVKPALDGGMLVLCDRYVDSSFAYQGYARGLGTDFIAEINSRALKQFPPDLTLFLDISPKAAFERKHGADLNDRMERQGMEFHDRVYNGYKELARNNRRIVCVQCGGTKFQTNDNIYNLLKSSGII